LPKRKTVSALFYLFPLWFFPSLTDQKISCRVEKARNLEHIKVSVLFRELTKQIDVWLNAGQMRRNF